LRLRNVFLEGCPNVLEASEIEAQNTKGAWLSLDCPRSI
jgi:hypothetical protein